MRRQERIVAAEAIFLAAIDLPAAERSAYVARRCGDDAELRALVDRLIEHDERGMSRFLLPASAPAATEAARNAALPDRIGDYEILGKIGEGGMATVYEARQSNPRRTVALKVIKDALVDEAMVGRFRFETAVLASLDHPAIARVYDAGETVDGLPYFAMEYVKGLPLTRYAGEHALDTNARFELMARICDAVHHAHEHGVLHRDLKPANILVTDEALGEPRPKILDFGVARTLRTDVEQVTMFTTAGELVGTLAYMSPEQVAGKGDELDARSDVYQLGVVLYELLAGERPYAVTELGIPQVVEMILDQDPPPLRSVDTRYRGDVEAIVGKALAKEKGRRYESAGAMAADLRRFMNHEPIAARPTSGLYRLRKLARRRKETVAGLVIGVLGAIVLYIAFTMAGNSTTAQEPTFPRVTRLTALPREDRLANAAISADGATLAFTTGRGFFLQDVESGEVTSLSLPDSVVRSFGSLRRLPPDGTWLLRGRGSEGWDWFQVSADGRVSTALTREVVAAIGGVPSDLNMSPDGRRLALRSMNRRDLWVLDQDSGPPRLLVQVDEHSYLFSIAWSPTSERIAYIENDEAKFEAILQSVDLDGNSTIIGEPELAIKLAEMGDTSAWLTDSRLLNARAVNDWDSWGIVAFDVDPSTGAVRGGPETLVSFDDVKLNCLSASTSGHRLTFSKRFNQREIYIVTLDAEGRFTDTPEPFTRDTRHDEPAAWCPAGDRLLFESNRFGNWDILSLRPGDLTPTRFLAGPDSELSLGLTSNGENLIVFVIPDGPNWAAVDSVDVFRVPLAGGEVQWLTQLAQTDDVSCGSVPGAPCVVRRRTESDYVYYLLDENLQPSIELGRFDSRGAFAGWGLSPDGRQLVQATDNGDIHLLDLGSGDWRLLANVSPDPWTLCFTPDGNAIYLTASSPNRIIRIDLDGGHEVVWKSGSSAVFRPRVSPDGKYLAFGLTEYEYNAWMLEDF